ncbi:MAG TPA: polysaccharide pyruvyl transferase family protein [Candidatus Elarobacter sp.]|jgi:pyruvyl transferase EpsO|nr:polysaccharide pyruvyl transferase family protein [Candidatus Elarobacter sp.]
MLDSIDASLAPLLEPGRPVALVNYPNHPNPGDNAIWLGTLMTLRRLGVPVRYTSTPAGFSEVAMRRAVGTGTLLLNGGGNFGDVYPGQQELREHVLARCTDRAIVQLPQSIWFRSESNLERMRRLCAAHPDFTLLVRERRSAEFAGREFGLPARLCPDMAFGLGALAPGRPPHRELLWIARCDAEAVARAVPPGVPARDWIVPDPADGMSERERRALGLNRALLAFMKRDERHANRRAKTLSVTFEPLASAWVRRGLEIVSSAGVIVTDRLHAHIFALLLGIPHVVLDNSYGKVRSTFETWTAASGLAAWADDAADALRAATALGR